MKAKGETDMKILHINCNYMTSALHQIMVEHLDMLGVESTVFAPLYDLNHAVIVPNSNVIVSECYKKWDGLIFEYKQSKILQALEKSCNIETFDMMHAYTVFTDGNIANLMSRKYKVPYVVAVRDSDMTFFKLRYHLRKRGLQILSEACKVFFLSDTFRQALLEKYIPKSQWNEIANKSVVIPNGIDDFWLNNPPQRKTRAPSKSDLKLVFVGKIAEVKNTTLLQKVVKEMNRRGWSTQLTVVGGAQDQKLLKKLQADPNIMYLGKRNKEEIAAIYREQNIFVMLSHHETFGLVYAEALSQGLPVIYTRGQGFDGQFANGYIGFAAGDGDEIEVADAIEKIVMEFDVLAERCIPAAKKFSWEYITKTYMEIYKDSKVQI